MILLSCSCNSKSANKREYQSVLFSLNEINDNKSGIDERKIKLRQIYEGISEIKNDSLRSKVLYEISYQYYKLNDSIRFRKTNAEAIELTLMLNDSNTVAMAYWDLAGFYHKYNIEDSAYYYYHKAQKIYLFLDDHFRSARLLLNMAIIQKNIKDYTGSEVTTIQAISLLMPLNKYKHLYRAYNNLGIVYSELEEYKKSLKYYTIAGQYLEKAERTDMYPSLWNNIGVVYNSDQQYERAAEYYQKAIKYNEKLEENDPELYAMLLDNQAYNRFQSGDTIGIFPQFKKALTIRKKHHVVPGIIISKLHLAEYFLRNEDTVAAVQKTSHAKILAVRSLNVRDLLASLMLLSKITKDSSLFYTREYIRINDSLQRRERTTRNKLARIRYETAGYIAKTERLSERLSKISLIGIIGGVILILLVIIQRQRAKNKELVLIQEKHKRFEEGKEKEKQRISRELHDGVLAKLFGVTMSLDVLNNANDTEAKEKRAKGIEDIKTISEEIRLLSHELSESSITSTDYSLMLTEFVEQQSQKETKFQLRMDPTINWERVDGNIKINVHRILQEGVQNIHKHARATTVLIELMIKNKKLTLSIRDNGNGFEPEKERHGIGLNNIKDRVKSMDGKLEIFSNNSVGQGTKLKITLPITPKTS